MIATLIIIAAVIFVAGSILGWSLARITADADAMIERLERTEGDG